MISKVIRDFKKGARNMKVTHVFKDNSTAESLENKVIKVAGNESMYQKLEKSLTQRSVEADKRCAG